MAGRNIFSKVPEMSLAAENGSGTTASSVADIVEDITISSSSSNHTAADQGLEISWLGHLDPRDAGIWVDSALLLVFGGIPWQVRAPRQREKIVAANV